MKRQPADGIFLECRRVKIRGDGSLSHAGMNRIRSQGLVSARLADTPSDPGDVVWVTSAPASRFSRGSQNRAALRATAKHLARRKGIRDSGPGALVGAEP